MTLWAYNDPGRWGYCLQARAQRAGMVCALFDEPHEVPDGARAFVHLDQAGAERARSKQVAGLLAARGVTTLPTGEEARWYDDKVAQFAPLARWLPRTHVIHAASDVPGVLRVMEFPFVSKSRDGSAAKAVRLIETPGQANDEARAALGGDGLRSVYNRRQYGYLYWQQFIPGNDHDWRFVVMGDHVMGLKRFNRRDRPMASGSGRAAPVTDLDDPDAGRAFARAVEVAEAIRTRWMAFDLVLHGARPLVLEMSSSWTPRAYADCPLFTRAGRRTGRTGREMFTLAAEILAAC